MQLEKLVFEFQSVFKVGYCTLGDFLQLAVYPNTEATKQAAGAGDDWSAFEMINRLAQFEFVGFQGEVEACKW